MTTNSDIARITGQNPDARVAAIAAGQNGLISREDLRDIGLNDDAIAWRVRRGRLFRVFRGVYSVGTPAVTPLELATAAVLAAGDRAALGLRSSLALFDLVRQWPQRPQVLTAGRRRPPGIEVRRTTTLMRSEVTVHRGVRTTTLARTLLDSAPVLAPDRRAKVIDDALIRRLVSRAQLQRMTAKHRIHPGAKLLEPHWNTSDGPSRSAGERRMRRWQQDNGLPASMQTNVMINGREADAWFPDEGVIVEIDGWPSHRSLPRFIGDRERDAENLVALDAVTYRAEYDDFLADPARHARRVDVILQRRRRYWHRP